MYNRYDSVQRGHIKNLSVEDLRRDSADLSG